MKKPAAASALQVSGHGGFQDVSKKESGELLHIALRLATVNRRAILFGILAALVPIHRAEAIPWTGLHDSGYLKAIGSKGDSTDSEKDDPWGFKQLWCTSLCAYLLNQNGIPFTNYYGGPRWGSASNWLATARMLPNLVEVTDEPNPGDIGFTAAGGGHVVYVLALLEKGKILTAEYNYAALSYSNREVPKGDFKYLRFKKPSSSQVYEKPTGFKLYVENSSISYVPGATFDLGRIRKGRSTDLEIILENTRSSREDVSVTVSGTGFSLESKPSSRVSAGRKTDFEVEFRPKTVGRFSGTFTVKFAGKSFKYSLTGTAY